MKREDVKNKIPGITEEQLNWLMQENGTDINREKTAAEQPHKKQRPAGVIACGPLFLVGKHPQYISSVSTTF